MFVSSQVDLLLAHSYFLLIVPPLCFIRPMFCYSSPSRMFIQSASRNMTGKARVFIFLSPSSVSSCAQVFAVTVQPPPALPPPPPPLTCLTLSAAHSQVTQEQHFIFFSTSNLAYPQSLVRILFLDIRPLSGQECRISLDVHSAGYIPVIQEEAFSPPHPPPPSPSNRLIFKLP